MAPHPLAGSDADAFRGGRSSSGLALECGAE